MTSPTIAQSQSDNLHASPSIWKFASFIFSIDDLTVFQIITLIQWQSWMSMSNKCTGKRVASFAIHWLLYVPLAHRFGVASKEEVAAIAADPNVIWLDVRSDGEVAAGALPAPYVHCPVTMSDTSALAVLHSRTGYIRLTLGARPRRPNSCLTNLRRFSVSAGSGGESWEPSKCWSRKDIQA